MCDGGDLRDVAGANDAAAPRSYSRSMAPTRREHIMKRIVTIGALITVFAVAPSVAAAGNSAAQGKTQLTGFAAKQQRVRLQPRIVFEQGGQQVWRAGNHIMY